jgi:hypothetical protein
LLTIKAIECHECGDTVYSRTHQDFRECTCGSISVNGGLQYFKYNAHPSSAFKIKKIQIDASVDELYEDYTTMKDRFGLISTQPSIDRSAIAARS